MKSIKVKNLTKKFGHFDVIKSAKFKIFPGKVTGFLGPNGAGKTTLFHLISGDLTPDSGSIILFDEITKSGRDIYGKKSYEIAQAGVGKLYQDIKIFPTLSIIENVVVGFYTEAEKNPFWSIPYYRSINASREAYEQKAIEGLKFVGLYEELRDGIYKKKAYELSYGQQKLLAFARLMGMQFDVLLLDEPTAGVNEFLINRIEIFITKMAQNNKSIAVIEHNVKVLEKIADFIYFMEDGRIEFSGTTDHVLNNKEIRQRYIGLE